MLRFTLLIVVVFGANACGQLPSRLYSDEAQASHSWLLNLYQNSPKIIAHRGDSSRAPENTLAAISSALETQASLIEFDVRTTADDELVVMHDVFLDRTTDCDAEFGQKNLRVSKADKAFIQGLDAGSWFDETFAGEMVPSLTDATELATQEAMALVEHKSGTAAAYLQELESLGSLEGVVVQSFHWNFLKRLHALNPSVPLVGLGKGRITRSKLEILEELDINIIHWDKDRLSQRALDLALSMGFQVWAYTVNETSEALDLVERGVDGITTNYPSDILNP